MKILIYHLLVGICVMWSVSSFAQTTLSDSLRLIINHSSLEERQKPALLNQLAETYRINRNYKEAENCARQSAEIAIKFQDYTEATKAYTLLVNIKSNTLQLNTLKSAGDSALLFGQKARSPIAMAYGYYAQVLLYKMLDDAENVVKFCNLGLRQLEKTTEPYIAAKIYYQLYVVNSDWNDEAKVNVYARKATENALKTRDYNLLSNTYNALSVAHEYNYNSSKNRTELDSALFYLNKAELLYHQYPGQVATYTYAIVCINNANYYLRYSPEDDKEAQANAIRYASSARKVLNNAANSQDVIASSLGILSEYAKRAGNRTQAENYLLEAYKILKTSTQFYGYTMVNVAQSLSDFYEKSGDYKKSLDFQKEVTLYNNKNFNQKQALKAQKLEIQYETEKKNNEMLLLKEREKTHIRQSYLYGCISIASILGLLFMFRSYHFKLRYSLEREKQLQLEKHDSEMQVKFEKEEQARLRAEQQLLEAQQEQLKKEAIVNVLQLDHKNQMLLNIKDKLNEGDSVNIQRILKEEMMLDSDFEDAKMQIQRIHPDFFNLINDKAQKKLTLLDLKLCAYLYLKLDTRQIAQLMHIESKSVRMSRYRIKQKLGLEKEEDLNTFLQGLGN